jgi:predicted phage terminase large subunit-like protein
MVCAPDYTMLARATFRVFCQVASDLGLLSPSGVKRSAPPEVRLRNGAHVLFASTDDPQKLRGPSLSAIVLDEASLMHKDAWDVACGRLRERGEMGWLSACFTPKGRANWLTAKFAPGTPDTQLFTARTRDNPFAPANFDAIVRRQYTSLMARQELDGEIVDTSAGLFKRSWFQVVERATVPTLERCRAWDLASTPRDERRANDPDYSVGTLVGRSEQGDFYVEHVCRLQGSPRTVEQLVLWHANNDPEGTRIVMEQEGGSGGKIVISHYLNLLAGHDFRGVPTGGKSKIDRAQPVASQAEGGCIKIVRGDWNEAWLAEVESFPFCDHDDQTDSLSLGFADLAQPRRKLWIGRIVGDHKNLL